jgi:superfamily II helicase
LRLNRVGVGNIPLPKGVVEQTTQTIIQEQRKITMVEFQKAEELARIIHEHFCCNRRSAALVCEASFLTRRSYLVSRRSQALIFLLARYASRFTNDCLLEIRFTRNALSGGFASNRHE